MTTYPIKGDIQYMVAVTDDLHTVFGAEVVVRSTQRVKRVLYIGTDFDLASDIFEMMRGAK